MKFKALISDVDGTLIPNSRTGMPSFRVTSAIEKASKLLHVGVATGRPLFAVRHILSHLSLSGPVILSGGAQIVDAISHDILWEQTINQEDIQKIITLAKPHRVTMTEGLQDYHSDKGIYPDKVLELAINALKTDEAEKLREKLITIPTIVIHTVTSWTAGKVDLLINHTLATKQHGIFEIAKILDIKTEEIIGIGDGGNDFPLLMACGFKVAMGNANDDLKSIADYVAPSVQEDGLAHVIEKFILHENG